MHLEGTNDLLAALMMPQGMGRLSRYLASRKPATILDRRRIVSTYLDRFGRPEVMEVDVALPGWTAELVSRMTESYERDLTLIATLPDVTVIEA
jgi:hypothetical protein